MPEGKMPTKEEIRKLRGKGPIPSTKGRIFKSMTEGDEEEVETYVGKAKSKKSKKSRK